MLQAAIDIGEGSGDLVRVRASFVTPPMYTPSPVPPYSGSGNIRPSSSPSPKPSYSPPSSPPHSAYSPRILSSNSGSLARTPTIATPTSLAIELIRETLYAMLADVLASTPSLISPIHPAHTSALSHSPSSLSPLLPPLPPLPPHRALRATATLS